MNKVKLALVLAGLTLGSANMAHAENFFSGITLGAGYASGQIRNEYGDTLLRPSGYSIYSKGYLVPAWKDYLFTDFRVVTRSDSTSEGKLDLTQYQAGLGVGYPFHLTEHMTIKPFVEGGWSWNTHKLTAQGFSGKRHDNGFLIGAGVESQFGEHIVATIGYSFVDGDDVYRNGSENLYTQGMFDLGYKF